MGRCARTFRPSAFHLPARPTQTVGECGDRHLASARVQQSREHEEIIALLRRVRRTIEDLTACDLDVPIIDSVVSSSGTEQDSYARRAARFAWIRLFSREPLAIAMRE
jgi:hypothetical protein